MYPYFNAITLPRHLSLTNSSLFSLFSLTKSNYVSCMVTSVHCVFIPLICCDVDAVCLVLFR